VHDETGGDQLGQQVVGRRARQTEVPGEGGRGDGTGLPGQRLQEGERLAGGGHAR
jgi:hypothetical protein